ncbi:MAG TPA: hypothetical protein VFY18_04515 [Candidatus Limnocylindrales bacterium]|nr:hypothetical protein [Candidatus Limnocylindrales bacterium]
MEQLQQALVADHIHGLERDAAALRAERARDLRAAPRETGTGPRRRLGRWLIAVGVAIAGRSGEAAPDASDPMASPV